MPESVTEKVDEVVGKSWRSGLEDLVRTAMAIVWGTSHEKWILGSDRFSGTHRWDRFGFTRLERIRIPRNRTIASQSKGKSDDRVPIDDEARRWAQEARRAPVYRGVH